MVWYVLCSIAVLYDHAETSYLFYSTGRVCRCHWLLRTQYISKPTRRVFLRTSCPYVVLFWDADNASACCFLASAALGSILYSYPLWKRWYKISLSIIGLVGFLSLKEFRTTTWRCHRYTSGQILEDLPCAIQWGASIFTPFLFYAVWWLDFEVDDCSLKNLAYPRMVFLWLPCNELAAVLTLGGPFQTDEVWNVTITDHGLHYGCGSGEVVALRSELFFRSLVGCDHPSGQFFDGFA